VIFINIMLQGFGVYLHSIGGVGALLCDVAKVTIVCSSLSAVFDLIADDFDWLFSGDGIVLWWYFDVAVLSTVISSGSGSHWRETRS
jgi:hypothetical protein